MQILSKKTQKVADLYGLNQAGALTVAKYILMEYEDSYGGHIEEIFKWIDNMIEKCPEDEYDENPLSAIELPENIYEDNNAFGAI